jgi:hypothetical protein
VQAQYLSFFSTISRSRVIVAFALIGIQSPLMAQTRSFIGSYHASIPNPDSDLVVCTFANNASVAKELKLSDDTIQKLKELEIASGGSFSSPTLTTYVIPTKDDIDWITTVLVAKTLENTERVREILNASQIKRLRQLVYQIEIQRVGLAEALLDGFCGVAIGIEDSQKLALRIRADAIERKASKELIGIAETTISELQLTSEQIETLKRLLGREFSVRNVKSGMANGRLPDPQMIQETCHLLKDKTVGDELNLRGNEIEETLDLLEEGAYVTRELTKKKLGRRPTSKEVSDDRTERIELILDPGQIDRIREIAYRLEIQRVGIVKAVTDGFLGKGLGMDKAQIADLRVRAEAIERNAKDAIAEVAKRSQAEMFGALEPRQRIEAVKVLGDPFLFRE